MKILVRRTILYYAKIYPSASDALLVWYHEFSKYGFANFNELKRVYRNASIISHQRVVFNVKGNSYRLIVSINFQQQACYVIWFGTHKEYDQIEASTITFDVRIL